MINVSLAKAHTEDYQVNEAYKTLRTNLQFCGVENKVIAVTSCVPDEGKSSISFNLSISLAEAGKRVAFVDADMRKSTLLGRYKVRQAVKGLAHYLSGQNVLDDVICKTDIENFYVIFSGPVPPNPAELLSGSSFKDMLTYLRREFDYVIIDTPPLGSVIDSAIVAQECDGAVMVIESRTISYRFAQKVKAQLNKANCTLLGVVLNKVVMDNNKYYSKYYGRYYGARYGQYGSGPDAGVK